MSMPTVNDEQCGKCGYDLTGLALVGRCPECGQHYDVLRGVGLKGEESSYQRGDRIAKRLRTVAWGMAALMCLGCGTGLSFFVPNRETALYLGLIFAGICTLAAITSYLYEREDS